MWLMARARWWWNGKWGRLARRDVIIHHEPEVWSAEAREGGEEGRTRRFPASDQGEAGAIAEKLISTDERRREMT